MTPQELKNSILQLAIQGKLVEQRGDEGTGAELLEKIFAAKNAKDAKGAMKGYRATSAKSAKESRLASNDSRPVEDAPFDIPESWEWVRLGEVCAIARGGSPRPIKDFITTAADGVNWIKIGDTEKDGKYICSTAEKIKPSGVPKSRMVHVGDFLLTNSMSFGRPYILKVDGCIHDGWLVISQGEKIFDQEYLYWVLSSGYAYAQFCAKVSGAVVKNLNSDKVANSVFPLPPLAEQKRIVAKIEELMPLVDRYEKAWSRLEDFNKRFPVDMQKSLLQMAIQGKLVEQRPEEGTAAELLEKILAAKNAEDAKGKGEKSHAKSAKSAKVGTCVSRDKIPDDEKPFEIPESWEWARLGEIADINGGFAFKSTNYTSKGVRVIRISDFIETGFVNDKIVRYSYDEALKPYILEEKNILLCMTGGTVGKSLFVPKMNELMVVNQRVAMIKVRQAIPEYVYKIILAPITQKVIQDSKNSTNDNISMDTIKGFLIPLPPLAEQKRIVAKLEELLPLCERLK